MPLWPEDQGNPSSQIYLFPVCIRAVSQLQEQRFKYINHVARKQVPSYVDMI